MGKRRHHEKHREEAHESHERWLVSYADFMTLLFAFFVVMYAISSVNQGKYRVLAESINTAFRDMPGVMSGAKMVIALPQPSASPDRLAKEAEMARQRQQMGLMAQQIGAALGPLVKDGLAHVSDGAYGVTVDINSSLLFVSGDAEINAAAAPALASVAKVLASSAFPVVVEGHTDNVPISTARFPSNWELSSMRAASLVRVFVEKGISSARLSAVGYADQRPLADNATAGGRERNRRVSITIAAPAGLAPAGALLAPR